MILYKYIEIKNLSNPQKAFERFENEFIDVMYPDHFTQNSLIMLLNVNIDTNKEKDMVWLKELLDSDLMEIGETHYFIVPFTPSHKE